MKRDANLVPLSRQHFRALALCMRIHRKRGTPADWQREMLSLWEADIRFHFTVEEKFLFPAARRIAAVVSLVRELRAEHTRLRRAFAVARRRPLTSAELTRFADLLEAHIRKEERQLFEECQKRMSEKELGEIGRKMEKYFRGRGATGWGACTLPAR